MEEEKYIDLSSIDQSYFAQHILQDQNSDFEYDPEIDYENEDQIDKKQSLTIDSFHLLSIIGKGSYAKVALVRKKDDGQIYALKIIKKSYIKYRDQKHRIIEERKVLEETKNQFVVKMKYAFQNSQKLFFVLEYCPGGELFNLLSMKRRFNEYQTQFYSGQIVLALEYLHQKDIIYRDLKPENVLIDAQGYIKITDFGLSKRNINSENQTKSICGTPEYLAPEILLKVGYGKMVDFWTLGAIMFEMYVGQPPFQIEMYEKREILFDKIKNQNPILPEFVQGPIRDLLCSLLEKDPSKRLGSQYGTQEIKKHKFFENFNWDKLSKKELEPPFKPKLNHDTELTYFDPEFIDMPFHSPGGQDKLFTTESQNKEQNYSMFTYMKSETNSVYSPLKQSPKDQQSSQQNLTPIDGGNINKENGQTDIQINMVCEDGDMDLELELGSKNTIETELQNQNLSLQENMGQQHQINLSKSQEINNNISNLQNDNNQYNNKLKLKQSKSYKQHNQYQEQDNDQIKLNEVIVNNITHPHQQLQQQQQKNINLYQQQEEEYLNMSQ